jgi:hypothetical protein
VINRQQDPNSKRQEEFAFQIQQARKSPEAMEKASPEVKEAAKNQASFSEQRKKYGL